MKSNFTKINKSLEKDRYFSTIWCTLDSSVKPYLQEILRPLQQYSEWLSTFGDSKKDGKYLPHISLRYLGFTDELSKQKLIDDKNSFSKAIDMSEITKIELGDINIWEQAINNKVVTARLSWKILDLNPLKIIHDNLLKVSGYQFFENLEGENYNPHISLGQINLEKNNYQKVKEYLNNQQFKIQTVKLDKFAINYATKEQREEIAL